MCFDVSFLLRFLGDFSEKKLINDAAKLIYSLETIFLIRRVESVVKLEKGSVGSSDDPTTLVTLFLCKFSADNPKV